MIVSLPTHPLPEISSFQHGVSCVIRICMFSVSEYITLPRFSTKITRNQAQSYKKSKFLILIIEEVIVNGTKSSKFCVMFVQYQYYHTWFCNLFFKEKVSKTEQMEEFLMFRRFRVREKNKGLSGCLFSHAVHKLKGNPIQRN